jgi:hypothetical protein
MQMEENNAMTNATSLPDRDRARQAAKHLIRAYVERGDSLASLRAGCLGGANPNGYFASIGGNMPIGGEHYSTDWILVYRDDDGNTVNEVFPIKVIYDELSHGQQQLDLTGGHP